MGALEVQARDLVHILVLILRKVYGFIESSVRVKYLSSPDKYNQGHGPITPAQFMLLQQVPCSCWLLSLVLYGSRWSLDVGVTELSVKRDQHPESTSAVPTCQMVSTITNYSARYTGFTGRRQDAGLMTVRTATRQLQTPMT